MTGWLPGPARVAKAGAALLGPILTTYTAVLFADTAVPAWHDAHRQLPFLFAGSALAAGAGWGLVAAPTVETRPLRAMAVVGAGVEALAERRMRSRLGMVAEPYRTGRPGRWLRAARWLTVGGAVLAATGRGRGGRRGGGDRADGRFPVHPVRGVRGRDRLRPRSEVHGGAAAEAVVGAGRAGGAGRGQDRSRGQRTTTVTPGRAGTSSPITG